MNIEIECFVDYEEDDWAQAKFLVRGYDDVFWTNDLDKAIQFVKQKLTEWNKNEYGT